MRDVCMYVWMMRMSSNKYYIEHVHTLNTTSTDCTDLLDGHLR